MEIESKTPAVWPHQEMLLQRGRKLVERVFIRLGLETPPPIAFVAAAWWENEEFKHPPVISLDKRMLWKSNPEMWRDAIIKRADELRQSDQFSVKFAILYTSPQALAFASLLRDDLRVHDQVSATVSLVSSGTRIGSYDCAFILEFPKACFEAFPYVVLPITSSPSLIHVGLLQSAAEALLDRLCGEATRENAVLHDRVTEADIEDVLRSAGARLLESVQTALDKSFLLGSFFDRLNVISSLRYESSDASATIRLVPEKFSPLDVQFKEKVPLSDAVWARKALQLAGESLDILSDSEYLLGLARKSEQDQSWFCIRIKGLNHWELRFGDKIFADVRLGVPSFPTPRLQQDQFFSTFKRVFSGMTPAAPERIWELLQNVLEAKQGALIVVSDNAQVEAERLSAQAIPIEPTELSEAAVRAAIAIDGAILLDLNGICHALGVILDGEAYFRGTPSRGARFNSALRYVMGAKKRQMSQLAVVISEDGHVDLLPRLRPQIRVSELLDALVRINNHPEGVAWPDSIRGLCIQILRYHFDYVFDEVIRRKIVMAAYDELYDSWGPFPTFDPHKSDIIVDIHIPDNESGGGTSEAGSSGASMSDVDLERGGAT